MTYNVVAKRWSRGWELHIDGVGVTQCRSLDEAAGQAADYIESLTEERTRADDVSVRVELGPLTDAVAAVRRQSSDAQAAQRAAAAASRQVAARLRSAGLSVADAAHVMGVSRGRVSQLTRAAAADGRSSATTRPATLRRVVGGQRAARG